MMAEAVHNEVFDELSRTFKEGSSSQSSVESEASIPVLQQTRHFVSKPKEPIPELIRYKEWLGTVKRSYEAAEAAREVPSVSGTPARDKEDDVNQRVSESVEELLEKAPMHSVKELVLHRMQLGDTLLNILFPPMEEEGSLPEGERQQFIDLCTRQNELSSAVLGHHSACEKLQKELDDVRRKSNEVQKDNRQLMDQLQKKIQEKSHETSLHENQRLESEIQRKKDYICIGRNVLQGLIVGSGINWAQDEELQELLISLGQPLKL